MMELAFYAEPFLITIHATLVHHVVLPPSSCQKVRHTYSPSDLLPPVTIQFVSSNPRALGFHCSTRLCVFCLSISHLSDVSQSLCHSETCWLSSFGLYFTTGASLPFWLRIVTSNREFLRSRNLQGEICDHLTLPIRAGSLPIWEFWPDVNVCTAFCITLDLG